MKIVIVTGIEALVHMCETGVFCFLYIEMEGYIMCGIGAVLLPVGQHVAPILRELLIRLEYRGYDSWGKVVLKPSDSPDEETLVTLVKKLKGPSAGFSEELAEATLGNLGIAHNRWASVGGITENNAHPHTGCSKNNLFGVQNGNVENYDKLHEQMKAEGHIIHTDVDSEILLHLIESTQRAYPHLPFEKAVAVSLRRVEGAFGFACIQASEPNKLVIACRSSPVYVAFMEDGGCVVASDQEALIPYTKEFVTLDDDEVGVFELGKTPRFFDLRFNITSKKEVQQIQETDHEDETDNDEFAHIMERELWQGPQAIRQVMKSGPGGVQGRTNFELGTAKLGGLADYLPSLATARRIELICSGTSEHASAIGRLYFERLARIRTVVSDASEFLYSDLPDEDEKLEMSREEFEALDSPNAKNQVWYGIVSQSGASADPLNCLRRLNKLKAPTFGLVGRVGSPIARETDCGLFLSLGQKETAVAATKTFLAQSTGLLLMALLLGRQRGKVGLEEGQRIIRALYQLPEHLENIRNRRDEIRELAKKYSVGYSNFLFFGRNLYEAVAREAALKLTEIAYIHAEGIPAGKLKHGFIALIDDILKSGFPVCFIAPHSTQDPEDDVIYQKTLSNMKEVKTREGTMFAIATQGNPMIQKTAERVFYIPKTHELVTPILATYVAHWYAYETAVMLGREIDQPRNLAKSVTVE